MTERKRPTNYWDEEQPFCPPLIVYEETPTAVETGLLSADGTKIYRRPAARPIGFDLSGRR